MSASSIARQLGPLGDREQIGLSVRSRHLSSREGVRVVYDKADVARRLAADEWLQVGAMAALADVSRGTMNVWVADAKERYGVDLRFTRTLGGQRKFHPEDVRELIAKVTKVHGGNEKADPIPE
jgi:hypothetical protein